MPKLSADFDGPLLHVIRLHLSPRDGGLRILPFRGIRIEYSCGECSEVGSFPWFRKSLADGHTGADAPVHLAAARPTHYLDDLLEYLQSLSGEETTAEDLADLQIRLEPYPLMRTAL